MYLNFQISLDVEVFKGTYINLSPKNGKESH